MSKVQTSWAFAVAWMGLLLASASFAQADRLPNPAERMPRVPWWMAPPDCWRELDAENIFPGFDPNDVFRFGWYLLPVCRNNVIADLNSNTATVYEEIVVTAVGDVMLGTTFPDASGGDLPPNDGAGLLDEVTPFLKRGDIIFGNLEGPLVDSGVSAKCRGKREGTCYAFRVPTRYGAHLKAAGFNVMGLANNHAMDFGAEGRESSRHVLEAQGIAHSGEVGDIAHLFVKGRRVDVVAFATYPGANNFLDLDSALDTIRRACQEADLVIVSFHGGAEGATHQHVAPGDETFLGEDRGDLRRFAHAAIDAGAHMVVGSGPHVVRGMEIYKGKLIAYSLGNFATYGPFNLSGESGLSLILEAHLAPDGSFIKGQVTPVKQEKPGGPRLDPEMKIVPILRALSTNDFQKNAVIVGPAGELRLPGPEESSRLPAPSH